MVYEVLRPLYGVPSSAHMLHLTLAKWMRGQGFQTVGFEDSVWSRPAGGRYGLRITVSAHIDDLLIACADKDASQLFKRDLLTRFHGTDEGEVEQYLGCEVIFDREGGKVAL